MPKGRQHKLVLAGNMHREVMAEVTRGRGEASRVMAEVTGGRGEASMGGSQWK